MRPTVAISTAPETPQIPHMRRFAGGGLFANPDAPGFHDPELSRRAVGFGVCQRRFENGQNRGDALQRGPEYDHTGALGRLVAANVGKVEVETHQDAMFLQAGREEPRVTGATQLLLQHGGDVVAPGLGSGNRVTRHILIQL